MPKVVVQTIERLTMTASAEAKPGRQGAASQGSGPNNPATGPTVAKRSDRRKMATPLTRASAATAKAPSMSSLSDGRSREAEPSSISMGATVIIPNPSDANQSCQIVNIGVVVL